MASTTVSKPLNSEPADPQERKKHSLPAKSFADSVQGTAAGGGESQPHSPIKSYASSATAVDDKEQLDDDKLVYEKHRSSTGTDILTTVKPDDKYEQSLKQNGATTQREKSKNGRTKKQDTTEQALASGRKAGAGWQRSAIRWAPLSVPLQRRLQTTAVLIHSVSIALFLSTFLFLCAIPLTWPILVPYLVYSFIWCDQATSGTLTRRSQRLRRSKIWSAFASYFPARLHRTVKLEPHRKYIFGYHPHGIISHGAFAAFATEALGFTDLFPGITNTLLTLDSNFRIPLYRDYALAMGLASVSKESIENLLSKGGVNGEGMGRAVTIVVGGARESLNAEPHSLRLVLNSRKGFVKLAIRQGADLVPVLAFGENDLYEQIDSEAHPWIHKTQMLVKKMAGFTVPLFHARGIFNYDVGMMPYRKAVNIVVGRPIQVVQQGQHDGRVQEDYLDEVHANYVEELRRLWEEHKDTFAKDRVTELELVE
ncbi:uncharacterized protein HMPREF1541_06857 [Cyphellophora europaea CBS 101466]|uniref:Diacylglycerol O-acyltransferase n=1 Tax=Cyphellophora europaea (strain CBS 101466) TaxID=1220924 RepID=W2RSU8_CYPE1|nr:uncharacterized protein HMPREF1541_06857 [Cyphellophora europaea CBS 101466]ETN38818.1 hypothetical protein HMPREF1541_06857 [Cyphellophora europaea CBS 101466]